MSEDAVTANRERDLAGIEQQFDLIVVGGGIVGTWVARDAAMRGLSTLLLEREDVAAETTAASTRLIHGGIRYLEQYEFGLVFEGLQERKILREVAPHLVKPLRFIIPSYSESLFHNLRLRLGLLLYDMLSYSKDLPSHCALSREEVRRDYSGIPEDGLHQAFAYYDCQVSFVERLCLENMMAAVDSGATVFTHAEVTDLNTQDGEVTGVTVEDTLSGETTEIGARTVINATGPWASRFDGLDEGFIRPAKGIHIVLPELTGDAVVLPTTDDRIIFLVPWNGMSLVGTTDTDVDGDLRDVTATDEDIQYLLEQLQRFFPGVEEDDIRYTYAGVRPLYDQGAAEDSSDVSRKHAVIEDTGDRQGLISVAGAKITAARAAAEEAVDAVMEQLGKVGECRTDLVQLPGAGESTIRTEELDERIVEHLRELYGSKAEEVIELAEQEGFDSVLCEHTDDIMAQVVYAVREEFALTVADVLLRRTTAGYAACQGLCCVEQVADRMQEELGWSRSRKEREIRQYREHAENREP